MINPSKDASIGRPEARNGSSSLFFMRHTGLAVVLVAGLSARELGPICPTSTRGRLCRRRRWWGRRSSAVDLYYPGAFQAREFENSFRRGRRDSRLMTIWLLAWTHRCPLKIQNLKRSVSLGWYSRSFFLSVYVVDCERECSRLRLGFDSELVYPARNSR